MVKTEEKKTTRRKRTKKITEEDLVLYFGDSSAIFLKKFEKIANKEMTFNFSAAFLGPFYFMYRKMYLSALVAILLGFILPANIISVILMFVFMGFAADQVYYAKAKRDIELIKSSKTKESIQREYIRQNGGVSLVGPMIYGAIIMITMFALVISAMFCYPMYYPVIY